MLLKNNASGWKRKMVSSEKEKEKKRDGKERRNLNQTTKSQRGGIMRSGER
jgi:hypothetical protein